MELKSKSFNLNRVQTFSSNRTFMELKLSKNINQYLTFSCSNRTFMELKSN